jgi:hypothetical protein
MLARLSDMIRSAFRSPQRGEQSPHTSHFTAPLDMGQVKSMVRGIVTTRPDEIDCDRCFEELDRFVEVTLAGKNAAEAMPLVQDHLERCRDCREEFEALLTALRALA